MSSGGHDDDFIARALVQASIDGKDATTAKKLGISTRTLKRWRQRAGTDEELARLVREKRAVADGDWAENLATAIRNGIDFLSSATKELDKKDPDAVLAVIEATKELAGLAVTRRILDARLAQQAGPPRAADRTSDQPGGAGEGEGEESPTH